jgi:hypothetical protein
MVGVFRGCRRGKAVPLDDPCQSGTVYPVCSGVKDFVPVWTR